MVAMRTRRKFTPEFKAEAFKLAQRAETSIQATATSLGLDDCGYSRGMLASCVLSLASCGLPAFALNAKSPGRPGCGSSARLSRVNGVQLLWRTAAAELAPT